ncbi:MAG: NAD(P)/FAD-dependent oxidoreductase [Peptoniphilaceae bacterium]
MYDIIIIGGGVIGTSIARTLSKYNNKIALLEKNVEVCQETTKANSAIIHGGYDCEPNTLKAELNVKGNAMFPKLSRELGFTFNKIGSLVLAFDEEEMKEVRNLYERGKKNKVKSLEIVDAKRVKELEPKVADNVKGALYCADAGVVDPFNLTYAMIENAISNGVELFTETRVEALEKKDDYILVKTNKGDYKTKYLVNAAGLYSDDVAKMAGDDDFKIIPTKGVYRLLDKTKSDYIHTVLFQTPTEKGKGVLVTATYDGNTMIGPTSDKINSVEDTTTESESLEYIDKTAKKSVPSLNLKKTIRVFTGVRAKPDTGDFMIYPSKNMKGLIHCGGIESPGLASSPAIAEYVENLLIEEGMSVDKNENYNPERKAIPRISQLSNEEKEKKLQENPKYGKIICRCETVSEAEIIEAINRPAGAKTVDGVKRRVRAGMGRCQGAFCGPRVLEILSRELNVEATDIKKDLSGSEIVNRYLKK